MIEVQKYLEGQIVDGRYPLIELLGSTQHSSVFRTECEDASNQQAALKLIPAPAAASSAQLTRWRLAARFGHPALLRIFDMGRYEFEDRAFLYVVMELAEENLAEVLPVRSLSPGEVSAMLAPALEGLAYLHNKGFVHGHLRPSNILAIGEQVKLSTDSVARIGEVSNARDTVDPYRAPEVSLSSASDVWSLGVTLVQCLTGRLPDREPAARNSIVIPPGVPAPFLDLAKHCVSPIPQRRWTVPQLQAALGHPSADPVLPEPLKHVIPEVSSANQTIVVAESAGQSAFAKPDAVAPKPLRYRLLLAKKYRLALAALAAASAAFALGIVISGVSSGFVSTPSVPIRAATFARTNAPANQPKLMTAAKESRPAAGANVNSARSSPNPSEPISKHATAPHAQLSSRLTGAGAAIVVSNVTPAPVAPQASAVSGDVVPGAISRRAVPRVPSSASNTIWGTVRVSVIVDVDPHGRVVEAKLADAGPSRYFARLSMAAARDWKFAPPRVGGNIVPSEWLIDFGYTKTDITATATEKHP
jgi:TonB family protein